MQFLLTVQWQFSGIVGWSGSIDQVKKVRDSLSWKEPNLFWFPKTNGS